MKSFISSLLLILVVLYTGCKDDNEDPYVVTCVDGAVTWERALLFSFKLKNVPEDVRKEVYLIVNSDQEYVRYIESNSSGPKIDFKRKSLVIVRVVNDYSYSLPSITSDCDKKELRWFSEASYIVSGPAIERGYITAILVPKLQEGSNLVFERIIIG